MHQTQLMVNLSNTQTYHQQAILRLRADQSSQENSPLAVCFLAGTVKNKEGYDQVLTTTQFLSTPYPTFEPKKEAFL